MRGISTDTVRTGKKYRLINHGDIYEFFVERVLTDDNFLLKDIHTLEFYQYQELVQFGKGKDYCLLEI